MILGVPIESFSGEKRAAIVPAVIPKLRQAGVDLLLQEGVGRNAGFPDAAYAEQGAKITPHRSEVFQSADILTQVHGLEARDFESVRAGQILVGLLDPFGSPDVPRRLAEIGLTSFALELLPRISRAQPMDALTSMANIAGYKAALLAAGSLHKMYPLLMTAAGTITPARVLVVGAGVAGLQAIATSRRLGAVVQAYDIRPAVKEQVESLGAKFVDLNLEAGDTETESGYAREMDQTFYQKQREMMSRIVSESDAVITTAAVPGKKAPVLITEKMVTAMAPGSIIVDLAAETGGNCEITQACETVERDGVTVLGPVNLSSSVPYHASQMYARNVTAFLQNLIKDGKLLINLEDEIVRASLLTYQGEVVHPAVRELLGLPAAHPRAQERSSS